VPELLFNGMGSNFKGTDNTTGNPEAVKVRPLYLNLPLNVLYNYELKNNISLFIDAGPNFGYGFFGKVANQDSSDNAFKKMGLRDLTLALILLVAWN
jgi:Outer membrane protein beta-barrel domain